MQHAPRSAYPQIMSHGSELAPLPSTRSERCAHPTAITMTYTSSEPALLQLAQYFQQALDKVGFKVTLKGDTVTQEFGYISRSERGAERDDQHLQPGRGSSRHLGPSRLGYRRRA